MLVSWVRGRTSPIPCHLSFAGLDSMISGDRSSIGSLLPKGQLPPAAAVALPPAACQEGLQQPEPMEQCQAPLHILECVQIGFCVNGRPLTAVDTFHLSPYHTRQRHQALTTTQFSQGMPVHTDMRVRHINWIGCEIMVMITAEWCRQQVHACGGSCKLFRQPCRGEMCGQGRCGMLPGSAAKPPLPSYNKLCGFVECTLLVISSFEAAGWRWRAARQHPQRRAQSTRPLHKITNLAQLSQKEVSTVIMSLQGSMCFR